MRVWRISRPGKERRIITALKDGQSLKSSPGASATRKCTLSIFLSPASGKNSHRKAAPKQNKSS